MARNRQRAKERQAERRAARKAARDETGASAEVDPALEAPPQELGQSAYTIEHTTEAEEFIGDLQVGDEPYDGDDEDNGATAVAGPRGVRGGREHEEHHRPEHSRVVGFLIAVWAELNRVQWPNRSQLTSLTGITLLFVLIVGGYLGLLDAIFSKLVSAIL